MPSKLQMRDADNRPTDDRSAGRNRNQEQKDLSGEEVVQCNTDERDARGDKDTAHGNAAA